MAGRAVLALAALLAAVLPLGCGDSGTADGLRAGGQRVDGKITVFAAASLTDAFNEIRAGFEDDYPGTTVDFNFGGTPTLRTQLEQGARADVFATADQTQMDLALQAGVVESAGRVFARNSLVIITPKANPAKLSAPAGLVRPGLKLVLPAPEVPAGAYSRQMLASLESDPALGPGFSNRVLTNVVSNESNVKQVVAKVQLGEADAGIVYRSDLTAAVASSLHVIDVPSQFNVTVAYPAATVKGSRNRPTAEAFIKYLLSPAGQLVLEKHGFTELS